MDIKLEKLQHTDAKQLYEFEVENRDFFEKMVPSRGNDYYHLATFKIRHEALLEEQAEGLSYFYLIKDGNGLILGRMNVIDIDKSHQVGEIGYRLGEAYTGKGIANKALKLLLVTMKEQGGIVQLNARTTTNNIASQMVLEKNGFMCVATDALNMNGQNLRFIYYKWNRG